MSQPHTIQIIWCIPAAVDIPIYIRGMWHHTVGTSHIYPKTRQHPLQISYFQENAYTDYIYRCFLWYSDKSTYQLMNKEGFLVLHLRTYSITSIVFYELTEASYLQLQLQHYYMHHLLPWYNKPLGVFQNVNYHLHNFWFGFFWMANNSVILLCLLNCFTCTAYLYILLIFLFWNLKCADSASK
jgi:hypothetical protein